MRRLPCAYTPPLACRSPSLPRAARHCPAARIVSVRVVSCPAWHSPCRHAMPRCRAARPSSSSIVRIPDPNGWAHGPRPYHQARPSMKASDLFVKSLEAEGVEYVFGIPGEENLDLLESLRRSKIRLILTRHEQAAGFMAATYGRLTGRTGVCLATLGPGATNFVTAAAYAQLGGMPMLMVTGQKPIKSSKQGHFQIVDVVRMMEPLTKYTRQIVSIAQHSGGGARGVPSGRRRAARRHAPRIARRRRARRGRRQADSEELQPPSRRRGKSRGARGRGDHRREASAADDRRGRQPQDHHARCCASSSTRSAFRSSPRRWARA